MTETQSDSLLAAAKQALRSGAHDQAIARFESYLEAHPAHEETLILAAQAYRYFNRNDRVVELYARAAKAAPSNPEILAGYIEALVAHSQLDRARDVAESAIAAHPEAVRLHLLFAHTDLALGNQDAAKKVFWTWLEKDPDNTDCAFQLGQLVSDAELPKLSAALDRMWKARNNLDAWNAATLGFAYGRVGERLKDYDKAWEGFSFGASKRRSVTQYDEATFASTPDLHARLFNAAITNPFEDERPGKGFVFIVNLPRSGSTLVEQILDAHPQVEAIGERPFAYDTVSYWHRTFGPDVPSLLSPAALKAAREFYAKAAREAAGSQEGQVIVDKSITNYVFLGFLRTILPGARFIHVVRHPLDTAISCFSTSFFAGNEWTYDLAEIGRHVRRYEKLMLHWMGQWPNDILTVRYEDVVSRPEDVSKEIVSFCGLEWDPACLTFHESSRPVLTASINQVRQPIYQSAMGRAARYEAHLAPLSAAMGRRAANPDWFLPKEEKEQPMEKAETDRLLQQAYNAYQNGAFARARTALERVLEDDPTHLDALAALTNACHQMSDTPGPIAFLERARAAKPDDEMILVFYVDALIADQKHQQAFDIASSAATSFPNNAKLSIQVARGWMGTGESDKAREGLWAAYESDPTSVSALYYLARIGDNSDLPRLEPLLTEAWDRRESLEPPGQLILAFARATVAEKQARIDDAWDAYVAGNEIHRKLVPFDEPGFVDTVNSHIQLFGKVRREPANDGSPGRDLIFIVSLPRSGSTLTEQILASHSRVKTIGERSLVFDAFNIWNAKRDAAALEEARAFYLTGARRYADCTENADEDVVIVDKSITNYIYVGFLRLLFPGARFVHVVRAPLDAAFSCYATPFGLNALKWCSDFGSIARVFRRYQRLMKVWMREPRGDLMTLSYEEMTADPEVKVQELIAFCDLTWEPACLKFHENKRQVATASASQVRRPIYKTAQGRAAPFDAYLKELKQVLGRAADPDWYKSL